VAGTVDIQANLVEGPCNHSAAIYFTVVDGGGNVVFADSSNYLPATVHWDTCSVPDGPYAIRSQRACGSDPVCAELGGPVRVWVDNP